MTSSNYYQLLYFPGGNFEWLNVTYDGHVLAKLKRDEALEAICLQMGALYLFDAQYEVDAEGGAIPEISDYFKFCLHHFLDLPVSGKNKTKAKGKQNDRVSALWNEIMAFSKRA